MKTTISLLIHHLNSETDFGPPPAGGGESASSSRCFLYVQSGLKDSRAVGSETQARCSILFFFVCLFLCFVKALAVLSLGLLCVR